MTIPNRVFIRNLPYDITEKEIVDVFSQFGNIIAKPFLIKDRGIAFLTYQNQKMYEKCRSMNEKITIKGRVIGICESIKNQYEDNFSNYSNQNDYDDENENEDTIFVGNIPNNVEDYEVREAFMKYQPYEVKLRNDDEYVIQYAYIRILNSELIDRALREMNGYNLKGSKISVSRAKSSFR